MRFFLLLTVPFLTAACFNMPSDPAQISGAYISPLRYEELSCSKLDAELNSLSRREAKLIVAQKQRLDSSYGQAFWLGFGQGDGVEASELATVRGEKEAVMLALDRKGCFYNKPR